jgi:hypothetical protein
MPTAAYPPRTARNVAHADGTAILSHGPLKGGSGLTMTMARRYAKPVIHLDLSQIPAFAAAQKLAAWIQENQIRILNVAGPRASEDPAIYQKTRDIIETVALLDQVTAGLSHKASRRFTDPPAAGFPTTIGSAVDTLVREMSLKDKATIANMTAAELDYLRPNLGRHILEKFGLENGNTSLLNACRFGAGKIHISAAQAVDVILAELWGRLRRSHRLRRVK